MRVIQPKGTRGSLKWIQQAIAFRPDLLNLNDLPAITWLSPREDDNYAEYRDAAFLDLLGLPHLSDALSDFWPHRGPQWDALGMTSAGPVLVEAKAHLAEFFSPPTQASPKSLVQIVKSFNLVQADLQVSPGTDWSRTFYQYSNRLAFLWWLRKQGIDAKLLFVSFVGDSDMGGPDHFETWEAAFTCADYALGLPKRHALRAHVFHVFPDVRYLSPSQV